MSIKFTPTIIDAATVDGKHASDFVWKDGTQSMTGTLNSTLAIGTPPITVTSTTKCTNLNADMLDDLEGAAYVTYDNTQYKRPVKCITSAVEITLSGEQTIDGYAVVAGDRVLVRGQSDAKYNGIYVAAVGAWTRATDFDSATEVSTGVIIMVENGTYQANTGWTLSITTPKPITIGTTNLIFQNIIRPTSASATAFATANRDGNGDLTTRVFISNAPSDPPLTVTSTARVVNLNADTVDGYHYTDIINTNNSYTPSIPSKRGAIYSVKGTKDYVNTIAIGRNMVPDVILYAHGVTAVTNAYIGGVYSPTQNRIYLVPFAQSNQTDWHYIDCTTGVVTAYAHGATVVANGYAGGVYSPIQNRIYLVPYSQGDQTNWHYIDCATGNVVAYAHGATVVGNGYIGGVYSPTQDRIYFVPNAQSNQSYWHYIDTSTGNVVAYAHGATVVANGYIGGAFSPTQNRIYLMPSAQSNQTNWHYIDCSNGTVVAYAHGATVVANGYASGVYSPTQDRIYFVPFAQSNQTNWHYIDCATGNVVAYAKVLTVGSSGYYSGVFCPTQNRIYLAPFSQSSQTSWHYIDCTTGLLTAYTHGAAVSTSAYTGGVFNPTLNRLYFVPRALASEANWHYIDCDAGSSCSKWLAANNTFNKF